MPHTWIADSFAPAVQSFLSREELRTRPRFEGFVAQRREIERLRSAIAKQQPHAGSIDRLHKLVAAEAGGRVYDPASWGPILMPCPSDGCQGFIVGEPPKDPFKQTVARPITEERAFQLIETGRCAVELLKFQLSVDESIRFFALLKCLLLAEWDDQHQPSFYTAVNRVYRLIVKERDRPLIGRCSQCSVAACRTCRSIVQSSSRTRSGHHCHVDRLIRQKTRLCPQCFALCMREDGCDRVYCLRCHTPFSYSTAVVDPRVDFRNGYVTLRSLDETRGVNQEV
jgi:hypothetical protein